MADRKKRGIPKIDKSIRSSEIVNDISLGGRYVFFSSLLDKPEPWRSIGTSAQASLDGISSRLKGEDNDIKNSRMGLALNFLKQAAIFEQSKEISFFNKYLSMYPELEQTFNLKLSMDMNWMDFISHINVILKGANAFKNELRTEINRINRMRTADATAGGKKFTDLTKEMQQ